jgi:hypothetical protein
MAPTDSPANALAAALIPSQVDTNQAKTEAERQQWLVGVCHAQHRCSAPPKDSKPGDPPFGILLHHARGIR